MSPNERKWKVSDIKSEPAAQILRIRGVERRARQEGSGPWSKEFIDRGMKSYMRGLLGLEGSLNYARSFPEKIRNVLDEGAGTTRGISEIAASPLGENIEFWASVLFRRPVDSKLVKAGKSLPKGRIRITSAETLRGFEDNFFAGVIGMDSVAYSTRPDMAAESLNRVLAPGGFFKGTFVRFASDLKFPEPHMKDLTDFRATLIDLGFDTFHFSSGSLVLLAIKPGAPSGVSAEKLFAEDYASWLGNQPPHLQQLELW